MTGKIISDADLAMGQGMHPDLVGVVTPPEPHLDAFGLPHKLGVKQKALGKWNFLACGQPIFMAKEELAELADIIHHWREVFAGGVRRTLIQQKFGTHSIIIRVDYFWKPKLGVQLCEVEERPAGLLATCELNGKEFRTCLVNVLGKVERSLGKKIAFCVSSGRGDDSDDEDLVTHFRWTEDQETKFTPKNIAVVRGLPTLEDVQKYVWWVRALRTESQYFDLERFALSTISQEGDKEYGVAMGRWFRIDSNWRSTLPIEHGCVLKPRYGSRFEHAIIVKTESRREGVSRGRLEYGIHGLQAAKKAIESGSVAYWQPYYPQEEHSFLGSSGYRLMRRAYFGFDPNEDRYVPMGGLWVAHNTARIHGARDALFGPLRLSEK